MNLRMSSMFENRICEGNMRPRDSVNPGSEGQQNGALKYITPSAGEEGTETELHRYDNNKNTANIHQAGLTPNPALRTHERLWHLILSITP